MKDTVLFISGSTGNVYEGILRSLTRAAAHDKVRVLAANTNYDNQMELQLLRYAERSGCRGVVMSSVGELEKTIGFIRSMRAPLVTVVRSLPGIADAVTQDSYEMGSMAAQRFLDAGHRHLAYLGGPRESSLTTDKLHGYGDVIHAYGLELREDDIGYGRLDSDSGHTYALRFLALDPRPTAIFISNDLMAIGFIQEVTAAGLRVPEDVSVLCCDKTLASDIFRPALCRFYIDWEETGDVIYNLLKKRRDDPTRPRRILTFDTKYEDGTTLCPLP